MAFVARRLACHFHLNFGNCACKNAFADTGTVV